MVSQRKIARGRAIESIPKNEKKGIHVDPSFRPLGPAAVTAQVLLEAVTAQALMNYTPTKRTEAGASQQHLPSRASDRPIILYERRLEVPGEGARYSSLVVKRCT